MSAVTAEAHEGPEHFEFPDKDDSIRTVDGWLLVAESTETTGRPQWTEMEVYRTILGKYVVRVLGCSDVYHRHGSGCNTGDEQLGKDMERDLVPCSRCHPPRNYTAPAYDDVVFNVEVDIPTIRQAENARGLIRALHRRGDDGGEDQPLSYLAGRVLRKLRRIDPAIKAELDKPVNLN